VYLFDSVGLRGNCFILMLFCELHRTACGQKKLLNINKQCCKFN